MDDATIRDRLSLIIGDLRMAPALDATLLVQEYTKRHGADIRVREIAAALLAEMFDPVVRRSRK